MYIYICILHITTVIIMCTVLFIHHFNIIWPIDNAAKMLILLIRSKC